MEGGRQVAEGTPEYRSVLLGAASHKPASLALL
jgi:hypothetical protein